MEKEGEEWDDTGGMHAFMHAQKKKKLDKERKLTLCYVHADLRWYIIVITDDRVCNTYLFIIYLCMYV